MVGSLIQKSKTKETKNKIAPYLYGQPKKTKTNKKTMVDRHYK